MDEETRKQPSYWSRFTGGRGLMNLVFGDFLADKNNAASIIAILLVLTLCYIVGIKQQFTYAPSLMNIVFVVIGYYFGSKREVGDKADDDVHNEGTRANGSGGQASASSPVQAQTGASNEEDKS